MIKRITIRDFFSFSGINTIEFNPGVNLLLGINGSGKTSLINALRLLYEGVCGDGVEKLVQEQWGGFDQIVNVNGDRTAPFSQITYEFDPVMVNRINPAAGFKSTIKYSITIRQSGTSYLLSEKIWTEHRKKKDLNFKYLDFSNGKGEISIKTEDGISFQKYESNEISGQELVLKQINDPNRYLPTFTLRKAIETMAVYNNFEVGENSRLRRPADFSTSVRLKKNGENLTQMLNELKLNHSFDFEKLEEAFRNVSPSYREIVISNLYGQSYLSLREKNLKKTIGALHISDGSLRYLLLESIFFNPNRGCLVAIDEPERGLHPDMIKSVGDMLKQASRDCQIIVATHSPHLLNQFELEDVIVFEKDEENKAVVKKVSEADFEEWEGAFLPGQMWLRGLIGGKRW